MKGIFMSIANFFKNLFKGNVPSPVPAPILPQPVVTPSGVVVNPPPTGKKYAVLVGINHYVALQGNDLQGCVNDVNTIWEFLIKKRGFDPDNIRMLCDDRATQQNILERLNWLIEVAKPGDELVFQYSGHGSTMRLRLDGKLEDEECNVICPTDMDWDNPFTDKMIAAIFKGIPQGAFLTFLSDSCHSATQDRDLPQNPHPTKARFLPPPLDIAVRSMNRNLPVNRIGWKALTGPTGDVTIIENQRHLLVSGCRDQQTSADAFIDGKYQGAMTASLKASLAKDDNLPWSTTHQNMLSWLKGGRYSQVPNWSGPTARLNKRPF